jgi:gliding motility-associated lipoprotein GldD
MTVYKFVLSFIILALAACNSTYTSKKKGYFNIEFPQKQYVLFDDPAVPYSFEYPSYARIVTDSTYFDSTPENPFWRNIDFPQFNARIFLSYKIIGGRATYKIKQPDGTYKDSSGINYFDKMVNDAFNLTNKNEAVASFIGDSVFTTKNGVSGVNFTVKGNAATSRQFFMSDTGKNFIRGALYFDTTPNADSLKPVLDFLQTDINHLINTFRWKNI